MICGPAFVGDVHSANGKVTSMTIERPYGQPSCGKVIVYGDKVQHLAVHSDTTLDTAPAPQLRDWQMRLAPEAAADYDDAAWKASAEPQQMGADGDTSAFAWYRGVVEMKAKAHFYSGPIEGIQHDAERHLKQQPITMFHFNRADDIVIFVNGRRNDGQTPLAAGRNVIAVLASHRGRDKAFNYMGTLDNFARKGLFGPVQVTVGGEKVTVTPWKMRGGVGPLEGKWQPVAATAGIPAFYRATFTAKTVPGRILRATSKGLTRGTMWLNGHNLGRYPEKIHAPGMYLPECWLKEGENRLVVFDEEGAAIDAVKLEVETAASREVITVSEPCDPSTPLVVPAEAKPVDPAAANKGNLAFKRPATASSTEAGNEPELACDGDPDTRWCAANGGTPQWWQVDLGGPHDLSGCEICWEADGRRYQYLVEGSADGRDLVRAGRPPSDTRPVAGAEAQFHGWRSSLRSDHGDRAADESYDLGQHLRGQGSGSEGQAVKGRERPLPACLAGEQVFWRGRVIAGKTPSPAGRAGRGRAISERFTASLKRLVHRPGKLAGVVSRLVCNNKRGAGLTPRRFCAKALRRSPGISLAEWGSS